MDLSIIIVNHNTKEFLGHCLDSLFKTMPPVDFEILVVNNTPTDGSSQMIAERFASVRVVDSGKPQGFAQNTNLGITLTTGRLIWLLNPDTLIKPGACEILMDFLARHPYAAMVGPRHLNTNGSIEPLSCSRFPSLRTDFLQNFFIAQIFQHNSFLAGPLYPQVWSAVPFLVDTLVGASILVRREIIEKVGYLDERFFMFLEETDWCWRVHRSDWEIWHIPQAVIVHFGSGSAGGNSGWHKVMYVQSYLQFYLKHYGRSITFLARTFLISGLILRVLAWATLSVVSPANRRKAFRKLKQWVPPLEWLVTGKVSKI